MLPKSSKIIGKLMQASHNKKIKNELAPEPNISTFEFPKKEPVKQLVNPALRFSL
jgi:hypothetical protein